MKRFGAILIVCACLFSSALATEATVEEELDRYFAMYDTLGGVVAVIQICLAFPYPIPSIRRFPSPFAS